jgi:hypothetical protein
MPTIVDFPTLVQEALVDHEGKLIEDVGWFWDHADERYVIAHDYLISNYVCPSGAHYPIEWKRFKKHEACAAGEFRVPPRFVRRVLIREETTAPALC